MAGAWELIADIAAPSGGGSGASANPILSDVGILVYQGTISTNDIKDFVVAGEQSENNSDGSVTFKYKIPYNGWVLGYSFTGTTNVPMQLGSYVTRLEPDGTGSDVIHVDPSTLPATQLQPGGMTYFTPNPPQVSKDELIQMKVCTASNNGGQAGNIAIYAYLHLQYDPEGVSAAATLQSGFTRAPAPQPTKEADVAIIDLGKFYCKDGEAPTSNSQLKDAYIDNVDGTTVVNVNNSRFAAFNGQVTSAAICLQSSVTCDTHVIIHTQGGDIGPLTITAGNAHTELTVSPAVSVNMGGYFYAEFYSDNASTGGPVSMSASVTFTPV